MPSHVVVGAGVNGLSVAWRLAERGADVLVLDKDRIGAGASGRAGGIVRNYYRSEAIREQHARAGYDSELVVGAERCHEYLSWTWSDWEAPVAAILHERRGGWADAAQTVRRLAERARGAGVEIREGVEVVGFERDGQVVSTTAGPIECE